MMLVKTLYMTFLLLSLFFQSYAGLPLENFLIIYVDAPKLSYSTLPELLHSIEKKGNFGHAWIHLEGIYNEKKIRIIGGHSGERGQIQPKYFDGIMDLLENGDKNPIRYLWEMQHDGFFQKGSGNHKPSFAFKVILNEEQVKKVVRFIGNYSFNEYSLAHHQCCTFVAQIAALVGITVDIDVNITIPPRIRFRGKNILLWSDPIFDSFTFSSPDLLEKQLRSKKLEV